jgi:hypothetical protein
MSVLTQISNTSFMNCLMASSVCGLVGLCGMDVEEMVDARLPVEADGVAVGWCRSKKRTLVPVKKQLIWAFVGG